jgi:ABC-type maltose transport system permease subunit
MKRFSKINIIYGICIIAVIVIILILFFTVNKSNKNNTIESFISESQNNVDMTNLSNLNIAYGVSGISDVGSIKFTKPFKNPPRIFTQIINNNPISNAVYGVNVFNLTNDGFEYSKYKVNSTTNEDITLVGLDRSTLEPFNWLAIG